MSPISDYAYEVPGKLEIPYRYFAGKCGSRALTALRDEKKIMATRCGHCNLTLVPARSVCDRCYRRIDEWVEVGPAGAVESFTVVRYQEPYQPMAVPFVMALIKLDRADTALTHLLGEVEPEQVKVGMRVVAVFSDNRQARITDIVYFRPDEAPAAKPKTTKAEMPVKKAAVKPQPKPAKKAAKKAEKKAVKKAVKKAAKKSAPQPAQKTVKKAAKKAVKKTAPQPAKKSVKKTAKKAVKKAVKKTAPKPVKKAVQKPAKKAAKKAIKKPAAKPAQKPAAKKSAKKAAKKAVKKARRR